MEISKDPKSLKGKKFAPFYFIQSADCQFGMIDAYLKKLDDPKWDDEIALSEKLIESCNKMDPKPKFLVVCGDLTHEWPYTERKRNQVADFKRIYSKLDKEIPLVCVCGNHEIGDVPTLESIENYKRDFGDDYFCFLVNDVLFIVINSQFYQNRELVEDYAREQDEWLIGLLDRCKQYKYTVVFEHIPWFLEKFDEEDEYFNITSKTRLEWLEKFHKAGVNKIMCGHYHRNAGGWYKDMELVVTSAIGAQLGDDKSGARIVKVLDDTIEHKYFNLEDLPEKVTFD